jgi:hypothetical protein
MLSGLGWLRVIHQRLSQLRDSAPCARRPGARRLAVLARMRHPSPGVHPLAVGHPPVAGLACPGRWREDESLPQPNTDSGSSCTSRSILEPEAPPEANGVALPRLRIS